MAVVRARTSPPAGLIAAVTFALLATAGAVIFYVMWAKADDTATSTLSANRDLTAKNSDLTSSMARLNNDLANARIDLDNMTKERDGKQAAVADVQKALDSANANAEAAQRRANDQQAEFAKTIAQLQDAQRKLEQQIADAVKGRQDDLAKSNQQVADLGNKDENERLKLVLQLQDAQSQVTKMDSEIRELRGRILNLGGGGKADVSVGEADGRVIRVNGAAGEVTISLGKKDRMRPGMPFTAYDPRLGVRYGTDEQAAGNGSLEVIDVGDTMSVCRITRTSPNHAIQAGDLISNIVYHNDQSRHYHFTIYGDFDLDGDGVYTAAERDRLISMIKEWGGVVDDDVTAQTDYLVLGAVPRSPMIAETSDTSTAPADAAATAPAPGSVADIRGKEQNRYEQLKSTATSLAIPVLNQNRFLFMIGYYNTTVVKY